MKTAMQELIDIIDKGISVLKESQIKERIILEGVKGEAEKLLEAEKEQIKGAYGAGAMDSSYDFDNIDSEQYYQQTFKKEQ